ncbi:OprO/OprP family phosphate-selective porin [Flavobacterium sp. N3904]|uniref:OprO/OprP family phosphate-selective porin n=1 Tax=Flavobacterium sp. N3904 TaxID=2986835 RepID=UPI002223F4C5|nr:OprO/OprP family phosphate-selective porin [Flavobacterium sp. N3904]
MKKIIVAIMMLGYGFVNAQEVSNDSIKPISIDSLQQAINMHQLKFDALNEQLSPLQEQVDKISKLRISGYMQVQYEMYNYQDVPTANGPLQLKPGSSETNVPLTTNIVDVSNSFVIRRARIKFTYQPLEGVIFVLQPNFSFSAVTLKDAYVQLNDPWINTFQLWVGQFNRPDYEVEFSSRDRIILERSRMSGILYPQERDLGAKIAANFATQYEIPLNVELAVFNGNFGEGQITNQVADVDSQKDVMLRAYYSLNFKDMGLGVDFGASGYYGKNLVFVAGNFSDVNNKPFAAKVGDQLDKQWTGFELQAYYDVLGGFALKSECNFGTISGEANATNVLNNNPGFNFSGVRDFVGYYVTLEKNFGTKYQAAVRFDSWDPNRRLSGNNVTVAPDLKVNTWSFALDYFFTLNTKIALGYSLPINETSSTVGGIYNGDIKNNITTLRFQASF